VDIGSYGRNSDSTIFKDSALYERLPLPAQIASNGHFLPHISVAHEAFGLPENVLRHYGGKNLTIKKGILNCQLS
jgi:hypothetical protein